MKRSQQSYASSCSQYRNATRINNMHSLSKLMLILLMHERNISIDGENFKTTVKWKFSYDVVVIVVV